MLMVSVRPANNPAPLRAKPLRRQLTEIELCAWIAQAEPGAVLEYHRGYLALDRTSFGRFADTPARAALGLLGSRAHDLAERGLVHLVQHRHGVEDYSYFAVARARSRGRAARLRIPHNHRGGRVVNAPANRPRLGDIPPMPIGEIAALPAPILALLQEEAEEAAKAARPLADWLHGAIALRYGDRAAAARRAEGKDTGTIRLDDGEVTVIAELPKKVDWDQAELATLVAAIRAEDEDPAEYVDTVLRVSERKYAAWPNHIRTAFERARTVKTGKPTFRLSLREER